MRSQDYIGRNPEVMLGKPIVKDTRIRVELIIERLGDAWSEAELLAGDGGLRSRVFV